MDLIVDLIANHKQVSSLKNKEKSNQQLSIYWIKNSKETEQKLQTYSKNPNPHYIPKPPNKANQ